jgi:uncharacterized protein (DUF983 family)
MRRRCPSCDQPGIFKSYFHMERYCPHCGMQYEREEGDWTGAVWINTMVTHVVFIAVLLAVAIPTWPNVPWGWMLVAEFVLGTATAMFFYPYSKTVWVAICLMFQPVEGIEEAEAALRVVERQEVGV